MSYLQGVVQGSSRLGQRIVVAGVEKIGKTTLACDAPGSLLIPLEMGYAAISTPRIPHMLQTWEEVGRLCDELLAAAKSGRLARGSTLVWDSATALERLIHDAVLRRDPTYGKGNKTALTMEAALGGYGKAYQFANELFATWLSVMDQLALYGGINIVITCHVFAARVVDPAYGEYDSWDLLLHSPKNQKNYGKREMLTQWADLVGFLHEPLFIMKGGEKDQLNRAISANKGRVIGVDRTPGYVAGNRYGLTGELQIPPVGGWNYLADPIYKATGGQVDLYKR